MKNDGKSPLHVAFSPSAAHSVSRALQQSGSFGRIIGFMDDLSFGPIDSEAPRTRGAWIAEQLGSDWHDLWHEACRKADGFWVEATAPAASPVAWVCRNHASEYCGFLEFVRRMADRPFGVIDASDLMSPDGAALRSLGGLEPARIIEAGLFARQTTLSSTEHDEHLDLWRRLRDENAPFRIVAARGLASARIDHFDDAIFACVAPEWRVGARIVGDAMRELVDRPFAQCPGDMVIWSRVLSLVDAGRVELRRSGSAMRDCQVRRLPSGQTSDDGADGALRHP